MKNLTTPLDEKQLTDIGRAMERSGHTNLEEYLRWVALSKTSELLSEK
jgi:hypothetical protein